MYVKLKLRQKWLQVMKYIVQKMHIKDCSIWLDFRYPKLSLKRWWSYELCWYVFMVAMQQLKEDLL